MRFTTPNEIIDAYREARRPGEATRSRNWDAVHQRIDAGETPRLPRPPRLVEAEPTPVVDLGSRRRRWIAAAVLGVAAALVLVVAARWRSSIARPDDARTPMQAPDQRVPSQPQRAGAQTTEPGPSPPPDASKIEQIAPVVSPKADAPSTKTPSRQRRRPTDADEPAPGTDGLRQEMQLVERAKRALAAGDPAAALAATDAHAARFPDGVLAQERFVTAIAAHCALDRVDAAMQQARRYRAAFADSQTAQRLARDPCPKKP